MEALVERRIFERMQEDFTGWYSIKDEKEVLGDFLGLDFSAGGLRVNARSRILEERALTLNLTLPLIQGPIEKAAQVVWQRELKPGWFQAGLKFFAPDVAGLWPLVYPKQYTQD